MACRAVVVLPLDRVIWGSLPTEQGGQGAKASVDWTVFQPPAPSGRYPAEHGAGGDGPQCRLFSNAGIGWAWPAPQLGRSTL
jgi:hypothetical protein